MSFRVQNDDQLSEEITLPASAVRLLKNILAAMAQGHPVALRPLKAELITRQAAVLLQVSRPYLIALPEERKMPFRLVGQHRRVQHEDLRAYKRKDNEGSSLESSRSCLPGSFWIVSISLERSS
jgi:excisionase family DNA binding protein